MAVFGVLQVVSRLYIVNPEVGTNSLQSGT